ncbi:MAG: hypothetical protein J0H74_16110 [Chitinophagaceae bacterium]|nr:hypothetical protein [Chitinophagaceae bacterium]
MIVIKENPTPEKVKFKGKEIIVGSGLLLEFCKFAIDVLSNSLAEIALRNSLTPKP